LQIGRKEFNYRRMVVGKDLKKIAIALQNRDPQKVLTHQRDLFDRSIVFMFPGQGSQYVNMGKELYETEPVFRQWLDRCSQILESKLGFDLRSLLYPDDTELEIAADKLKQTQIAQPALFAIEYALAQLWMSWGIKPQAAIGHSIGEYVAATIAGVMSFEDALSLVALRGKLVQQMPPGAMLAVSLSEMDVRPLLDDNLSLAAINAPSLCVISGTNEALDSLEQKLNREGIECRHLYTSHAFHSAMMDAVVEPLQKEVAKINLNPPQIPFLSNVTDTWITPEEATDPHYWARHLRETVRFAAGIDELLEQSDRILLEVGAGRTLSTFVKHNSDRAGGQIVLSSLPHPKEKSSDVSFIFNVLGRLWLSGVAIDWSGFYTNQKRQRLPLPTYPFERQRYWLEVGNGEPPEAEGKQETGNRRDNKARERGSKDVGVKTASVGKKANIADWFYVPSWKLVPLVHTNNFGDDRYLVFVDESGIGLQLVEKLQKNGLEAIAVREGEKFSQIDRNIYTIDPNNPEDYQALWKAIEYLGDIPTKVVHLWSFNSKNSQNKDFWSLLYLAQAIEQNTPQINIQILVGTNNFHNIVGDEILSPDRATVLGACKTIAQEYSFLNCRQVDVVVSNRERSIEQLIQEANTISGEKIVAYRGDRRWVQIFEPISLEKTDRPPTKLRQEGVYLITGGMGGISLVLAEYLARTVKAKLILLGRSELVAKENWDEWLAKHDSDNSISQKILKIKNLEALGAEVLTLNADICDREQTEKAIDTALNHFGTINGVIHAAGVAGGGIIQLKTPEIADRVFAPKITGTLVLNDALQGIDLDFLVLCSSLSSIVGGFGQADYCAANNFLDAFANFNTIQNNRFTVSINWDAWQEVGMAVNTPVPEALKQWQADNLKNGLLSSEAIEVFDRILASSLTQVIVSTQDLPTVVRENDLFLAAYITSPKKSIDALPVANSPSRSSTHFSNHYRKHSTAIGECGYAIAKSR
jgi:acyl transferase domain-containing protein